MKEEATPPRAAMHHEEELLQLAERVSPRAEVVSYEVVWAPDYVSIYWARRRPKAPMLPPENHMLAGIVLRELVREVRDGTTVAFGVFWDGGSTVEVDREIVPAFPVDFISVRLEL